MGFSLPSLPSLPGLPGLPGGGGLPGLPGLPGTGGGFGNIDFSDMVNFSDLASLDFGGMVDMGGMVDFSGMMDNMVDLGGMVDMSDLANFSDMVNFEGLFPDIPNPLDAINSLWDKFGGLTDKPADPTRPGFETAAERTAAGNLEGARTATEANRITQANPFGTSAWQKDPSGNWSQSVDFSPEQQNLYNLSNAGKADLMGSGTPSFGSNREKVMDAMLARSTSDIEGARDNKRSNLIAQGIPLGSKAYDAEMERFDRQLNDARNQAEISATSQAATEYNADLAGRGQQADFYGSFSPTSPTFNSYYNQQTTPGADYMNASQQEGMFDTGVYNQKMAARNAIINAIAQSGQTGAMLALSDRRLKRNIKQIGVTALGLPLYTFNYLWNNILYVGHMADEVEKVVPEAVIEINGFKAVNYGML